VLTYVNEAAWGDLRELLKDIGISNQTIRFSNIADMIKAKEGYLSESDKQFANLQNARLTMIDMTEYEYNFPSTNEVGDIPLTDAAKLNFLKDDPWPQSNALIEEDRLELLKTSTTSRTHAEFKEDRNVEEEEEEEEEDDDDEDEDEDEEGEGDGDEEEEEDDEEEEEEDVTAVPNDILAEPRYDDRYFDHHEKLRDRFNEVELDSFMKLLNIKPNV
jgi:hypothetical protein